MALIRRFSQVAMTRNSVHDEIGATFSPFMERGQKYVQIDSYGRQGRDISGKKSQSIQLDEEGARSLVAILRHEFEID